MSEDIIWYRYMIWGVLTVGLLALLSYLFGGQLLKDIMNGAKKELVTLMGFLSVIAFFVLVYFAVDSTLFNNIVSILTPSRISENTSIAQHWAILAWGILIVLLGNFIIIARCG